MQTAIDNIYWQAVINNNSKFDGEFYYAVKSTKIYCRPSCKARKPRYKNVVFFANKELAIKNGFRACKLCKPEKNDYSNPQTRKILSICRYIEANLNERLSLEELSNNFELSPSHLQRTFKKIIGISPQKYLEASKMNKFKALLQDGDDISGAIYSAGFSSSSQIYSKNIGMTAKTYQEKGVNTLIKYTVSDSSLGKILVAATTKGICAIQIADSKEELEDIFKSEFANAHIIEDNEFLADYLEKIIAYLDNNQELDLPTDVKATAFQHQVWEALQKIPYGETRSYGQLAQMLNKPKAYRAVASACAKNPVALVVPCHRVIGASGDLRGFRWGLERKKELLFREQTRANQTLFDNLVQNN